MRELSAEEVDETLTRNGVGVLSLFDGTHPYAIPMSFGYDGSRPIFALQLGVGEDSRKQACLETTTQAAFTVYEQIDTGHWRSVVITGELTEVPDDEVETAFAALTANAVFAPDVSVWGVPLADADLTLYELELTDCNGREFSMGSHPSG
jgi:nitroimidazol reductase NimA-like FMN-containing flavoprotein (pyridoxamine 5'-phosphate oxidase superfamily)